jgi:molecular chaperone DnaK
VEDVLLLDVVPLSIGVETGGGVMTVLIPRNTTIPCEASEVFTTSVDNQNFVPIHVLQGERAMSADCRSLAEFELTGIPPAPRGVPKIHVTFYIDADGILNVEATDMGTGQTAEVAISPHSGLNKDEIESLIDDSSQHREADLLRAELAELKNQAETLVYTTEQALEGYADLIDTELLNQVKTDCDVLKGVLEGGSDFDGIQTAYAQLEGMAFRIAESIYGDDS